MAFRGFYGLLFAGAITFPSRTCFVTTRTFRLPLHAERCSWALGRTWHDSAAGGGGCDGCGGRLLQA